MNCPKCTGSMEPQSYNDTIHVHRCNTCAGLWCTMAQLAKMKREWMSEGALDIGNPRVGERLNAFDDIDCPEGHGRMVKTTDPEQTHIWFEVCNTCSGVFLDAGEFTDLKYRTLMDRVRGWLKGERPDIDT